MFHIFVFKIKVIPIKEIMRSLLVFIIFMSFLFNCNTFQKNTIPKSQTKIDESTSREEIEKIIENVYSKKDSVQENQKDEFVEFFIRNIEESDAAKTSLMKLYEDPNYNQQKEFIWNNLIEHMENPEVFDFVQREVLKDPERYDLNIKQKLLQNNDEKSAKLLLDLIYLGKEQLDPDIIYLFKNNSYEDSLPILVQSIENEKFVDESIVAISSLQSEDAQTYLINLATDYQNPHRNTALSNLVNIENKELAYTIYRDVLNHPDLQNDMIITTTINSLKKMVPYLNENQKKELQALLDNLPSRFKKISKDLVQLLLTKEESKTVEKPQNQKEEPKPNLTYKEEVVESNHKSKNNVVSTDKKAIKKDTYKNQNNKTKKSSKEITQRKSNQYYSIKYANKVSSNLKKLFSDNASEIQKKIHNALLTYSRSNSDRAKFIQSAYKRYYNLQNEEEVKDLLKQGLYTNESLFAILKYIKEQYNRKDLQIFVFQELFLVKRIESSLILDNINLFR